MILFIETEWLLRKPQNSTVFLLVEVSFFKVSKSQKNNFKLSKGEGKRFNQAKEAVKKTTTLF